MLREIDCSIIIDEVKRLCIESNIYLPLPIKNKLLKARDRESEFLPHKVLDIICSNFEMAEKEKIPVCQDTGMASVFIDVGQDVHIVGGSLTDAVNAGVREGYRAGYLRKSTAEPLSRLNIGDNTPAVINYNIVEGDKVRIIVAPKGFGSENMCVLKMLRPSDGRNGVVNFVIDSVRAAGAKPCPPLVLGVGVGGNFESVALLSKKALFRDINIPSADEEYRKLEVELLEKINKLGIGAQGVGGNCTALAVNVEHMPTHIAGLPVAVSFGCHVTRHSEIII